MKLFLVTAFSLMAFCTSHLWASTDIDSTGPVWNGDKKPGILPSNQDEKPDLADVL